MKKFTVMGEENIGALMTAEFAAKASKTYVYTPDAETRSSNLIILDADDQAISGIYPVQ